MHPTYRHCAVVNDDAVLAAALLASNPACLEAKNKLEQTPFLSSCMLGTAGVALLLLQKGAEVPATSESSFYFTPRFYAQRHKMDAVLALLTAKGK